MARADSGITDVASMKGKKVNIANPGSGNHRPSIDKLLSENAAYAAATIPGGNVSGQPEHILSWGPKATFVTSANVSDDVAYAVVSAVFENFDAFKKFHRRLRLVCPR